MNGNGGKQTVNEIKINSTEQNNYSGLSSIGYTCEIVQ
jgi:hypothetical protein